MKSFDEFDLGVWTPNVDLNSFGQEFRGLLGSIAPDLGSWMNGLRPVGLLNNLFFYYQSGFGAFYRTSFSGLSLNGFRGVKGRQSRAEKSMNRLRCPASHFVFSVRPW